MNAREAVALAVDFGRVLLTLPAVERGRTRAAPGPVLARMRARGRSQRARTAASKARLARAIGWVDRFGPGGPNCLRRTLLRVALDPDAAGESVVLGLDLPDGSSTATGHAWVRGTEERGRYDVEFPV